MGNIYLGFEVPGFIGAARVVFGLLHGPWFTTVVGAWLMARLFIPLNGWGSTDPPRQVRESSETKNSN